MDSPQLQSEKPVYRWPRYVLAAVILGIVLAVLAIAKEARRVQSMEHLPVYRDGASTGASSSSNP